MDLTAAIAKVAETAVETARDNNSRVASAGESDFAPAMNTVGVQPVFQLSALPLTIDPRNYVNPRTNSNPNGNQMSLFQFRALVDPVPAFNRFYTATAGASTENFWDDFINGASVSDASSFASGVLAKAQMRFAQSGFPNIDGSIGQWRPAYAMPEDWFDFTIPDRFVDFTIDLASPDSPMSGFATIPGNTIAPPLNWLIEAPGGAAIPVGLDPRTRLKALRAKALVVAITRPWLDFSLLKMNGIYLPGQPSGLYSSGNLNDNDGVLPLLPNAFCLATGVEIEGDWSGNDINILSQAQQNQSRVALGHFALSSGAAQPAKPTYSANFDGAVVTTSAVQLIGWISTLVPLCPRTSG